MTTPMNLLRNPLSLLLIISALGACVPGRKYEESQSRLKAAVASASAAEARSIEATTALTEVQAQRDALRKELDDLAADTAAMGTEHRAFERKYTMLNQLNNELLDKYTKLMEGDRSENRKLLTDLETVRLRLMSKEDSLNSLGRSLADREAKLAELQAELEAKDKAMKGLKDRVSKALTGFEGKGLTVEQRGGKIYVSLENKLLFPSGSIVVDQRGRDALVKLAKAIENEKDLNILVEGHTDTDKVLPGSTYKDNWDLSVLRATSVVRILQEGSKLDPKMVTAGGRGEYVPVDPADKSRNRRIEVILAPDLTELYKLVKD
jgi:chemotaxis protein MotB